VPKKAVEDAREQVAAFLGCSPVEIIFTSSGSESDNLGIKGVAYAKKNKGNHIITTKVEHPAVLKTCKYLEKEGFEITYLNVDSAGMMDTNELRDAITDKTILISVMYANNETGVIFPIEEIGRIAKEHKISFHTDAVQAAGKLPIDTSTLPVDLLTISGHKLYAPKGVGALFVRRGTRVVPIIHGGHHERNRRGGTENVAGIVGLGKACEMAAADMERERAHLTKMITRLEEGIKETIPHVYVNGGGSPRLVNTSNISFEFIEGESILIMLDDLGISASSGSACTSGSLEPSHVLRAMGIPFTLAHGSIRFSLSRYNTEKEIDYVIEQMPAIVDRLREISPFVGSNGTTGTFGAPPACST
jgi:cysteine desulfurase